MSDHKDPIVITGAARTPMGGFQGDLSPVTAPELGGAPLGFWFAQQGSIYVFVILIFVYVSWMNKLDKKYDVDEE